MTSLLMAWRAVSVTAARRSRPAAVTGRRPTAAAMGRWPPAAATGRRRRRTPAPAGPGPWPQPTDETLAAPVEAETLRHDWHMPGPATAPPSPFQGGEYQDGTAVAGTHEGLPRRIRQASLAPQLRDVPPPRRADRAGQAEADPTRSAEAARDLMSRMQRGWERGRADAERHDPPMA